MQTYRKKPVVVQAMQWDGTAEGATPIIQWVLTGEHAARYECKNRPCDGHPGYPHVIEIDTLEGPMTASPGDWVIRGVKGEFYPCKPDIFDATYEAVNE